MRHVRVMRLGSRIHDELFSCPEHVSGTLGELLGRDLQRSLTKTSNPIYGGVPIRDVHFTCGHARPRDALIVVASRRCTNK